ncbi:MAG: hypothetical protein M1524_02600 [Patescibacteria group bacterium]|nr:hypothetical protein [Patescibacteria group bacterium]
MIYHEILLSLGSFPWLGLKKSILLIKRINYDGLEILPTRKITQEVKKEQKIGKELLLIKGIHQSWRLDNGLDAEYRISIFTSFFYRLLRYVFFPSISDSNETIAILSKRLNVPLTIHDISETWTLEFKNINQTRYNYEIFNNSLKPSAIKTWLELSGNNIAIDTRDDQSLIWAKQNGFKNWKEFWKWLGLKKIKNIQLTLIGRKGISDIFLHKHSVTEEQLLWLNKNNWKGSVTVEANPLNLFILSKGNVHRGLILIGKFIRSTLDEGRKWSE